MNGSGCDCAGLCGCETCCEHRVLIMYAEITNSIVGHEAIVPGNWLKERASLLTHHWPKWHTISQGPWLPPGATTSAAGSGSSGDTCATCSAKLPKVKATDSETQTTKLDNPSATYYAQFGHKNPFQYDSYDKRGSSDRGGRGGRGGRNRGPRSDRWQGRQQYGNDYRGSSSKEQYFVSDPEGTTGLESNAGAVDPAKINWKWVPGLGYKGTKRDD